MTVVLGGRDVKKEGIFIMRSSVSKKLLCHFKHLTVMMNSVGMDGGKGGEREREREERENTTR